MYVYIYMYIQDLEGKDPEEAPEGVQWAPTEFLKNPFEIPDN
jgi:hypothetical protein